MAKAIAMVQKIFLMVMVQMEVQVEVLMVVVVEMKVVVVVVQMMVGKDYCFHILVLVYLSIYLVYF